MKIGIIGAGKIGGTVGRLWSKAGHQLRFGTRHPEQLAPLAAELGASAGTPEEAVAFAEVVLLAVPLKRSARSLTASGSSLAPRSTTREWVPRTCAAR